jgi:hypothetical protein
VQLYIWWGGYAVYEWWIWARKEAEWSSTVVCVPKLTSCRRRLVVEEDGVASCLLPLLPTSCLGPSWPGMLWRCCCCASCGRPVWYFLGKLFVIFRGPEVRMIRSCNNCFVCIFAIFFHNLHRVFDSTLWVELCIWMSHKAVLYFFWVIQKNKGKLLSKFLIFLRINSRVIICFWAYLLVVLFKENFTDPYYSLCVNSRKVMLTWAMTLQLFHLTLGWWLTSLVLSLG